jgi:glycosyltransferase involved in cell wall biosynthesis
MIESINWIPFQYVFEFFNRRNNQQFADSILESIDELGFKDIILFNDNDMFRSFHLKEFLKPAVSIYYSRDYMLAVDYWKKHGNKMEPELIAKSDICVANSTYLANYCKKYNPYSFYVGQGCELDIFMESASLPIPSDMKGIDGPVIGYVGALQQIRLDINALLYIAETKPEWNLVLVGPEDNQFMASALHQKKNVFFLGSKNPNELPAYINAFDVCINPQVVNQVTVGNYPRKIDEYLAVGKPVVATNTEAMGIFSAYCYLAENKEAYIVCIEDALTTDSIELRQGRKLFAATHTWGNCIAAIDESIYYWFNKHNQK